MPTTRGYSLQRKAKSRKAPGAKSKLFHAVETRLTCVSKLDRHIIMMFKIANAIVTVLGYTMVDFANCLKYTDTIFLIRRKRLVKFDQTLLSTCETPLHYKYTDTENV